MRISDWSSDVCSSDLDDFKIGHGGAKDGIPVHQPFAAIDKALFVQVDEGFDDPAGQIVVHGEVFARPVGRGTQPAELLGDGAAGFLFPFPDLFRSEEHTSELQSLMRISYAVFCLKKKT